MPRKTLKFISCKKLYSRTTIGKNANNSPIDHTAAKKANPLSTHVKLYISFGGAPVSFLRTISIWSRQKQPPISIAVFIPKVTVNVYITII